MEPAVVRGGVLPVPRDAGFIEYEGSTQPYLVATTSLNLSQAREFYDQQLLDQLYANALTYIHGHSVGGTNPSLLRAMGAGAPVLGYDVEFTHEVTAEQALFWADADQLQTIRRRDGVVLT